LEDNLVELQYEAISKDGTKIPYFVIHAKGLVYDGTNPTLLYGYGGFEISLTPYYLGTMGSTWLNPIYTNNLSNTVYVLANIRGGGEFGPSWHQQALLSNRHKAYEDFIAVAEDLIHHRNITNTQQLAIRGGSNGGLLMGNMFCARPDLFEAIVCEVPLLDMKRYHTLLAGNSWMAEYGNPSDDLTDWNNFLQFYSPYHNIDLQTLQQKQYPALLMITSTKDDRVHPYHARCFVKRLLDYSSNNNNNNNAIQEEGGEEKNKKNISKGDVIYYENIEGGHGGAADNKQVAFKNVSIISYFVLAYEMVSHIIYWYYHTVFIISTVTHIIRLYALNSYEKLFYKRRNKV
jgi:prolyl oligopeptidase